MHPKVKTSAEILSVLWKAFGVTAALLEKPGRPGQLRKLVSGQAGFFHIYSRFSFFVIK